MLEVQCQFLFSVNKYITDTGDLGTSAAVCEFFEVVTPDGHDVLVLDFGHLATDVDEIVD